MEKDDIIAICGNSDLQEKLKIEDLIKEYTVTFDIQSSTVLRERQELDAMKSVIRDYS
jgi:hypothetical protein